jgi:hypothetical protein
MDISEGISPASHRISTEDAAYPEGDEASLMGDAAYPVGEAVSLKRDASSPAGYAASPTGYAFTDIRCSEELHMIMVCILVYLASPWTSVASPISWICDTSQRIR